MENIADVEIIEDLRQSEAYGKYMQSIGWKVVKAGEENMFIRQVGPVAIAKLQRTKFPIEVNNSNRILKERRVVMCKIEPLGTDKYPGFSLSNWPLLGTKTLRVNLKPDANKIFGTFKKDCRYVLRKLADSDHRVRMNNFDNFYEIWERSAKRKSLWIPKHKEYSSLVREFGSRVFCITIDDSAGALVCMHKHTAFYYYAGSTTEGTKRNLPYLVVWTAMKEAKKMGCKVWDFEGIYDERWPNKGWLGFSHFKKSFGGVEVKFPGSFEKWRWPF